MGGNAMLLACQMLHIYSRRHVNISIQPQRTCQRIRGYLQGAGHVRRRQLHHGWVHLPSAFHKWRPQRLHGACRGLQCTGWQAATHHGIDADLQEEEGIDERRR